MYIHDCVPDYCFCVHHSPQSNQQHPDVLQTTTLAYRSDDTVLSGICDVFVRYAGSTEGNKSCKDPESFWQFLGPILLEPSILPPK